MRLFANRSAVCALDIGSSKIAGCFAGINRRQISGIWFGQVPSSGVRDGVIVDPAELVGCIGTLMKDLRRQSGLTVNGIFTSIPANEVIIRHSRAIIPLTERGAKLINEQDLRQARQQARILGSNLDEEIMHAIPVSYTVDSRNSVLNPLGLYGHKLEVDLLLVCAKTATVQNLDRVVHQAGYEIEDIFFSGISSSTAVFDPGLRQGSTVLCDIGSDTTEIMVFHNGLLRDVDVLSSGGNQLTSALRDSLKIPWELAEEIKKSYGAVGSHDHIAEDKEILVKKSNLYKPIKQRAVAEIVHTEAQRMCMLIRDMVEKKIPCHEVGHFVAVGRTALLEGFIELLEETLAVPVNLGSLDNPRIVSAVKDQHDLSGPHKMQYLAALGIICEALYGPSDAGNPEFSPSRNPLVNAAKTLRAVYQDYF